MRPPMPNTGYSGHAMHATLKDHARDAVRAEVLRCAWQLFGEQGYDATTIDDVAASAGMSRRTFFRYFASKDELVLDRLAESGARIAEALEGRPIEESPWLAVRRAFDETVRSTEQHGDLSRRLYLMLEQEPALRATVEEWRRRWADLLAPPVARRLGVAPDDLRAAAMVASALACYEVAQRAWAARKRGSRRSLTRLLDEAMAAVAPLDPM